MVVLDYHKLKLENHVKSTEILGRLLGREETAEEMIKDYTSAINLVQERILSSGKEPRKVYMELGNNGIGEYGNSYTGCLWGSIIDAAGGINIADEVLDPSEGYGPLDREFVLAQNPDIIIIGGSIWTGGNSGNDQMRMGLTVKKDMALERLLRLYRPGGLEKPDGDPERRGLRCRPWQPAVYGRLCVYRSHCQNDLS